MNKLGKIKNDCDKGSFCCSSVCQGSCALVLRRVPLFFKSVCKEGVALPLWLPSKEDFSSQVRRRCILIAAILIFGILIFSHELGHFLAARWAG